MAGCLFSVVWALSTHRELDHTRPPRLRLPWRELNAWLLTLLFALQGLCYYGLGAWLPDAYLERGWSGGASGGLVAAITAAAVPASFLVPRLSERLGSRWPALAASGIGLLIGSVALAEWPATAWGAVIVIGVSLGGLFSLCLLAGDRPRAAGPRRGGLCRDDVRARLHDLGRGSDRSRRRARRRRLVLDRTLAAGRDRRARSWCCSCCGRRTFTPEI